MFTYSFQQMLFNIKFIINITAKANDTTDIFKRFDTMITDDNSSYRNVCKMSVVSFALAVIFIIRLFSTSVFRVPNIKFVTYK